MSVLSNASLREMFPECEPGPASLDLHLGESLLRLPYGVTIDPEVDQGALWDKAPLREDGRWWLAQNVLYLGVTQEMVTVPGDMIGLLHGVSSLGRLGLLIHVTAGVADPGYTGRLTLELVSLGGTILLRPGQRIGQLTMHKLDTLSTRPYSGKYLNDEQPTPSRFWQETQP